MKTESISVTVSTRREGVVSGTLFAELWHDDGEDHAEVSYEAGNRSFALDGPEALVFLAVVARDAAGMLAQTPSKAPNAPRVPKPRRQAGFER